MPKLLSYAPINVLGWSALLPFQVLLHDHGINCQKLDLNKANALIPITAEEDIPIYAGIIIEDAEHVLKAVVQNMLLWQEFDTRLRQISILRIER